MSKPLMQIQRQLEACTLIFVFNSMKQAVDFPPFGKCNAYAAK